jgi:hypothetical protein
MMAGMRWCRIDSAEQAVEMMESLAADARQLLLMHSGMRRFVASQEGLRSYRHRHRHRHSHILSLSRLLPCSLTPSFAPSIAPSFPPFPLLPRSLAPPRRPLLLLAPSGLPSLSLSCSHSIVLSHSLSPSNIITPTDSHTLAPTPLSLPFSLGPWTFIAR